MISESSLSAFHEDLENPTAQEPGGPAEVIRTTFSKKSSNLDDRKSRKSLKDNASNDHIDTMNGSKIIPKSKHDPSQSMLHETLK